MRITVRDVARMFDAPERTIERWIREDGMPHHKVHGQYRFHATELVEWATRRGIRLAEEPPASVRLGAPRAKLAEALERGGIHYGVSAPNREALLQWVSDHLPIGEEDKELVYDVLLARERLMSTGVGDGIAIPHVSTPLVAAIEHAVVSLCFLERPIDFHAIDGKPIHTVFTLAVPTHRAHLAMLARLSAALHDREFRRAVQERAPKERILALCRAAEAAFDAARENGNGNGRGSDPDSNRTRG